MLARARERGERLVNRRAGGRCGALPSVAKGRAGGPSNGALISARLRNISGRTSAHHAATDAPKSCPITASACLVPQRRDQSRRIPHRVQQAERRQIVIEIGAPPGRPPIPALIRRHDIISRRGQPRHHLAPRIRDLRKPVQQEEQRPVRRAGLEDMDPQPIDAVDKARADAAGEDGLVVWGGYASAAAPSSVIPAQAGDPLFHRSSV